MPGRRCRHPFLRAVRLGRRGRWGRGGRSAGPSPTFSTTLTSRFASSPARSTRPASEGQDEPLRLVHRLRARLKARRWQRNGKAAAEQLYVICRWSRGGIEGSVTGTADKRAWRPRPWRFCRGSTAIRARATGFGTARSASVCDLHSRTAQARPVIRAYTTDAAPACSYSSQTMRLVAPGLLTFGAMWTEEFVAGRPARRHIPSGVVFRGCRAGLPDGSVRGGTGAVRAIERSGGAEDTIEPFFASAGDAQPVREVRVDRSCSPGTR